MEHQYMVFHRFMRNAKIYTGDTRKNPHDEYNAGRWMDFQQDPLMGTVIAKSEKEAIAAVAEKYDIHVSNLYAKLVTLSANSYLQVSDHKYSYSFEATSFIGKNKSGFDITLPDGRTAIFVFNKETRQINLVIRNEDGEEKIIKIEEE